MSLRHFLQAHVCGVRRQSMASAICVLLSQIGGMTGASKPVKNRSADEVREVAAQSRRRRKILGETAGELRGLQMKPLGEVRMQEAKAPSPILPVLRVPFQKSHVLCKCNRATKNRPS